MGKRCRIIVWDEFVVQEKSSIYIQIRIESFSSVGCFSLEGQLELNDVNTSFDNTPDVQTLDTSEQSSRFSNFPIFSRDHTTIQED